MHLGDVADTTDDARCPRVDNDDLAVAEMRDEQQVPVRIETFVVEAGRSAGSAMSATCVSGCGLAGCIRMLMADACCNGGDQRDDERHRRTLLVHADPIAHDGSPSYCDRTLRESAIADKRG